MGESIEDCPDSLVRIVSSSLFEATSSPIPLATLLSRTVDSATQTVATRTLFEIVSQNQHLNPQTFLLLVTHAPEASSLSLEDAQERCTAFLSGRQSKHESSIILLLRQDDCVWDNSKSGLRSILIVLSKVEDAVHFGALLSNPLERKPEDDILETDPKSISISTNGLLSWTWLRSLWPRRHGYNVISSTTNHESSATRWRRRIIIGGSVAIFAIIILVSILTVRLGHKDAVYDRYITTGSEGPRHQLRIYWQNASEWATANPQDTGKWKVRIDDQAIIPSELYDEDEEHYQEWYRTRYPEMQQVIDNEDYVRPSWMGSLDMMVPWDDQFHFAHCVLALRRYWKAKETGKHVCGRDIDYLHIDHCLGALEKRVFIDGPRDISDPPTYLYWQTKVCF